MNIFDADHPSDLGGLFSKIKKAVKEAVKNPVKALKKGSLSAQITKKATKDSWSTTKKVRAVAHDLKHKAEVRTHKTILGNTLGAKVDKFKASPEFQGVKKAVVTAIGTYVGGPMVGKALGGALTAAGATTAGSFIAAQGAALGAGSMAAAIGKGIASGGVQAVVKNRMDSQIEAKNAELQAAYEEQYTRDIENVLLLAKDPDMQQRIITMLEAGMTPDQIRQEWVNSNMFATLAQTESTATGLPLAMDALMQQGIPPEQAEAIGEKITSEIASKEISSLQGKNLFIPLALAALTFLG